MSRTIINVPHASIKASTFYSPILKDDQLSTSNQCKRKLHTTQRLGHSKLFLCSNSSLSHPHLAAEENKLKTGTVVYKDKTRVGSFYFHMFQNISHPVTPRSKHSPLSYWTKLSRSTANLLIWRKYQKHEYNAFEQWMNDTYKFGKWWDILIYLNDTL